jgi:teichuronic acid biosynthesis glycosyltransferase TuaC
VRVLVVTNMWPTPVDPAFGVFVRDQVEALRARGVAVDVRFIDGRASTLAYARAIPAVRRAVLAGGYDLVHAHYVLSGLAVHLARRGGPVPPLVVTYHGIEVFRGWQSVLSRWLVPRVERVLVTSPAMARHLGLPAVDVVPMGVDLARFRPGSRAAARTALSLPAETVLVAWVGTDRPEKRLDLARAAVTRLRAGVPRADLLVVTGRPHEEVPLYLQAADVLLLSSSGEGAPVVVKEALACDCPVVGTDVGDVRAVVGGVDGCAVVDATPEAMAAGLRRALAHGPVDGRAAVAPYDMNRTAARVHEVYGEVLRARAGRPACAS